MKSKTSNVFFTHTHTHTDTHTIIMKEILNNSVKVVEGKECYDSIIERRDIVFCGTWKRSRGLVPFWKVCGRETHCQVVTNCRRKPKYACICSSLGLRFAIQRRIKQENVRNAHVEGISQQ